MIISSDDRLAKNHEHLIGLAHELDDVLITLCISYVNQTSGVIYPFEQGLHIIRNQHNMYPKQVNKHPVWIAYGEKYMYFMSSYESFYWLNYIPITPISEFQPEVYGTPQV